MTYDQKTGDGAYLEKTLAIIREVLKQVEAETPAEPQNTMRSGEGADSTELRFVNCQR